MKCNIILIIFLSLWIIPIFLCLKNNEVESNITKDISKTEKLTKSNNTNSTSTTKKIKEKGDPNLTIDEMDKMMFCSYFVQEAIRKDKDRIDALAKKLNSSNEACYEKLGADVFTNCLNISKMSLVHTYFKNLSYLGDNKWQKEYEKFIEIDYDKYKDKIDLNLEPDQESLTEKFSYVAKQFQKKQADIREKRKEEREKLKFEGFDLENIPRNMRGFLYLGIFALMFFLSLILLKTLINTPKSTKKKKKTR